MLRVRQQKVKSLLWSLRHADQDSGAAGPAKRNALGRTLWRGLYDGAAALALPKFRFIDLQYKEKPAGFRFPCHQHSRFHELYLVDQGALSVGLAGQRPLALRAGQGVLFKPGQRHEIQGHPSRPCDILTIHFELEPVRGLAWPRRLAGRALSLPPAALARLRELLQDLDRGGPHRGRLASLGLWELLLHLDSAAQPGARTARVTTISARSRFAGQVEAIIRRRVGEKLTLASIAAEACTSVSQLAHAYKAACGETVKQAVLRCRLESAKALLREGRQEIKEVAHATGFSSAAAFAAVFRRLEGRPPSAYQRQLKPQR